MPDGDLRDKVVQLVALLERDLEQRERAEEVRADRWARALQWLGENWALVAVVALVAAGQLSWSDVAGLLTP